MKKNPFNTHLNILKKAIEITNGPVLEIGCGNGSTNFLHEACLNRTLYTIENNEEWLNKFVHLETKTHKLIYRKSYDEFDDIINMDWDVVLVDHAPAERRNVEISKLHKVKYVVVHDTEDSVYNYELTLPNYKYKFDYKKLRPETTVVSDICNLDIFKSV